MDVMTTAYKPGSGSGFASDPEAAHIARCIRNLKSRGLPLENWECVEVVDVREDEPDAPLETCQLCGCSRVRYLHIMSHGDTDQRLAVGCICAGVMEGDILGAKDRERQFRNRKARQRKFIAKPWESGIFDGLLIHKKKVVVMSRTDPVENHSNRSPDDGNGQQPGYTVYVDDQCVSEYKGRPIRDELTAKYAAFELMDPDEEESCLTSGTPGKWLRTSATV